MACSYLMSTDNILPAAKKKETEEWTEVEVEALMSAMPTDDPSVPLTQEACESTHPAEIDATNSSKGVGRKTASEVLAHVLELHSSKRMKVPSSGEKGKQGVSIPGQRRWLHYWLVATVIVSSSSRLLGRQTTSKGSHSLNHVADEGGIDYQESTHQGD